MPESIEGSDAPYWTIVRDRLKPLDSSRILGPDPEFLKRAGPNYRGRCDFEEVVRLCRHSSNPILIGFMNWRSSLRTADLDMLRGRRYKVDDLEDSQGRKSTGNWVPGSDFLERVAQLG